MSGYSLSIIISYYCCEVLMKACSHETNQVPHEAVQICRFSSVLSYPLSLFEHGLAGFSCLLCCKSKSVCSNEYNCDLSTFNLLSQTFISDADPTQQNTFVQALAQAYASGDYSNLCNMHLNRAVIMHPTSWLLCYSALYNYGSWHSSFPDKSVKTDQPSAITETDAVLNNINKINAWGVAITLAY